MEGPEGVEAMKKENFKLDDDMIRRIEAFAETNKLTKSSAIRLLLARALGDDIETAYIGEVVLRVQNVVRGNVGKLLAKWEKELVTMLSSTLETSRDEVEAQMPPEVTDFERQAVRARAPGQKPGGPAPAMPGRLEPLPQAEPILVPIEEDEGEDDDDAQARMDAEAAEVQRGGLRAEAEALFWENYRTILSELGPEEPTELAATEATGLARDFSQAAIAVGWSPPVWGTPDFETRKAAAFPQGGVRGRR